jgi:transcription antitermination factor NusG
LLSNPLQWFAIRVKSNREKVASSNLSIKGYEVFLPVYNRRWLGAAESKEHALFPGYLFCRFNVKHRLPILMVPGIVHIVGLGKTPIPLDEEEVQSLRLVVNAHLAIQPVDFFVIGQKVRVDRGPLAGAIGIITGRKAESLVVSIILLQRSVSVDLAPEWINLEQCGGTRQVFAYSAGQL